MNLEVVQQAAVALWPLVVAGGVGRVGEMATETAAETAQELWVRVRNFRADRNQDASFDNYEELLEVLQDLSSEDKKSKQLIRALAKETSIGRDQINADSVVITNVKRSKNGQFGIINNSPRAKKLTDEY